MYYNTPDMFTQWNKLTVTTIHAMVYKEAVNDNNNIPTHSTQANNFGTNNLYLDKYKTQ